MIIIIIKVNDNNNHYHHDYQEYYLCFSALHNWSITGNFLDKSEKKWLRKVVEKSDRKKWSRKVIEKSDTESFSPVVLFASLFQGILSHKKHELWLTLSCKMIILISLHHTGKVNFIKYEHEYKSFQFWEIWDTSKGETFDELTFEWVPFDTLDQNSVWSMITEYLRSSTQSQSTILSQILNEKA